MKKECSFEYSESMKNYREKNNVENKIESVKLKDSRQLNNKFPKFLIELTNEYGKYDSIVKTRKLSEETFQVVSGFGQFSFAIIELV